MSDDTLCLPQSDRVRELDLEFTYNWSNRSMPDDVLIRHVLERGIFLDMCKVAAFFGLNRVLGILVQLDASTRESVSMQRKISNITIGFL